MTYTTATSQRPAAPAAASGHHCEVVTGHHDNLAVVSVLGRLDWASSAALGEAVRDEAAEPGVIIDLGATTGMDSVGVGTVLTSVARATARRQRVAVVVADGFLREVLLSTGLRAVVPVLSSREDAIRGLGSQPRPQPGD